MWAVRWCLIHTIVLYLSQKSYNCTYHIYYPWPGDWPEAQVGEAPAEASDDAEEAHMDEEMSNLLGFLRGSGAT